MGRSIWIPRSSVTITMRADGQKPEKSFHFSMFFSSTAHPSVLHHDLVYLKYILTQFLCISS